MKKKKELSYEDIVESITNAPLSYLGGLTIIVLETVINKGFFKSPKTLHSVIDKIVSDKEKKKKELKNHDRSS